MFWFEVKKVINKKNLFLFLAIFILSCIFYYIRFKGVYNAGNTKLLEELYRGVRGRVTEETVKKMEADRERIDTVIAEQYVMENAYIKGEVNVDDYVEYRDLFHKCQNEEKAFDVMYGHYLEVRENGWHMVFDSYYNKLFDLDKKYWGLILSVFLMGVLLAHSESEQLAAVLKITPMGKKVRYTKFKVVMIFSAVAAVVYILAEYGIMAGFSSFEQLGAPVQSIGCLSAISLPVSIGEWMVLTGVLTIVAAVVSGSLFLAIFLYLNKKFKI